MLKTTIKKLSTGEWQRLIIECPDGNKATATIVSTSPYALRFEWDMPREVRVYREPKDI